MPARGIESYTQGLMDLGATICTAREPSCAQCPVTADCVARLEERIAELPGSAPARSARRAASRCWSS
jgi:A/G-specific adenine glycosylase